MRQSLHYATIGALAVTVVSLAPVAAEAMPAENLTTMAASTDNIQMIRYSHYRHRPYGYAYGYRRPYYPYRHPYYGGGYGYGYRRPVLGLGFGGPYIGF